MSVTMKQLYGWTGPTPVGTGYARYLMVFDLGGLYRFVVRDGEGKEHHIDIPVNDGFELGNILTERID